MNFINLRPERDLHQKHFETHHIYPKSIANKNNIDDFDGDWNLIELTFREHFIAHMILFYCGYKEMTFAFNTILYCNSIKINSRIYEKLIKNQRDILKEKLTNTVWVNNGKKCKQVKLENIPKGWRYGSLQKQQYVTWINNGELNKKWDMSKQLPDGFTLGRIVKGFFITNGEIAKLVQSEEDIPEGWRKGRLKRTKEQIKNNLTI